MAMKNVKLNISLLLIVVLIVQAISEEHEDEEDYYWKDYTGEIPKDALPGGTDKKGLTTYIGKVLISDGKEKNGEIRPESKSLIYASSVEQHTVKENVKILCVHNPELYQWIPANSKNMRLLSNKHLILGGYSGMYASNIGRIQLEDRVVVGEIYESKDDTHRLIYVRDGEIKVSADTWQVLSFNPRLPQNVITKRINSTCGDRIYHINFY